MEINDCPWYKETVYKHDYKDRKHIFDYKKATEKFEPIKTEDDMKAERAKLDSLDPVLINGQFARNLHVQNELMPYIVKDHPMIKNRHEEYEHFLNRFKNCECCRFCRDFSKPPVNYDQVLDILRKKKLTVYQHDYSSDGYGRSYTDKFFFMKPQQVAFQDLCDFQDIATGPSYRPFQRQSINSILKTGRTVYINEISKRAEERLKIEGPLDPYTNRKV